ncbi:TIGR04219 family outer membrane beta-barrel protein [Parahaliea mediterranea]|uniref:TIGR04219 family outer membrane beta-barrel protein n=1 Tax=Parahaliea mediterranea TaxID=651086 RepID=A0A939DDY5_9GAMM|nr:TIGR04219 family outer membrane beta-barrel protein [Parahaliea mediterranea]MBN7795787.1 TIGR04219 family outer membrane beta-barrel protein [Parahaliea mediterranea]
MNRVIPTLLLAVAPSLALADIFAVKAGAAAWMVEGDGPGYGSDAEQQLSLSAALEHPIPLIPNVKLRYWDYAESDRGRDLELTTLDAVLYYEILDNPAIDLDLGVSATNYSDGRAPGGRKFEGWLPQLYGAVRVPVLGSDLGLYAEGTATNWDDSSAYDFEGGVDYLLDLPVLDLSFRLGYRQVENDFDDFDDFSGKLEFSGWSLGVLLDL